MTASTRSCHAMTSGGRYGFDFTSTTNFAPAVEKRLLEFEQHELRARPGWLTYLRQVTLLPVQQAYAYQRCVMELRAPLRQRAAKHGWTDAELSRRQHRAHRMARRYLFSVVRVARSTRWITSGQ